MHRSGDICDLPSLSNALPLYTMLEWNVKKQPLHYKYALGTAGAVRNLVPRTSLEIRDIDTLTEAKEVEEALKRDLGDATGEMKIFVTKPNGRDQRLATWNSVVLIYC